MKTINFSITVLLTSVLMGCSTTVPVTAKFPDVPANMKINCPELEKLKDSANLSDISKTMTKNYTAYYECAVKTDAWIEWYQTQKKIFESVK